MSQIRLSNAVKNIIACPFCKTQSIKENEEYLYCHTCCATFKIHHNGTIDFRVIPPVENVLFKQYWIDGQKSYEQWAKDLPCDVGYYQKQIKDSTATYTAFCDLRSICGTVLDIGGSDGRLRHFLPSASQCSYVSIDPYLTVREDLSRDGRLEAYPILAEPCDFVCGMAEHLPFIHNSVDFVRMNSVLDHLWDAHLGMREIVRVLKPNGLLLLGVAIFEKKGRIASYVESVKDILKIILHREDKHIWHPTREEVDVLAHAVGLENVKEMFSAGYIQILFRKPA